MLHKCRDFPDDISYEFVVNSIMSVSLFYNSGGTVFINVAGCRSNEHT